METLSVERGAKEYPARNPGQAAEGSSDGVGEEAAEVVPHLLAVDHPVDLALFQEEFRALESLREVLLDRLLDDARAGESDQGPGLGEDDVGHRGERGGDPPGRRVGEDGDREAPPAAEAL